MSNNNSERFDALTQINDILIPLSVDDRRRVLLSAMHMTADVAKLEVQYEILESVVPGVSSAPPDAPGIPSTSPAAPPIELTADGELPEHVARRLKENAIILGRLGWKTEEALSMLEEVYRLNAHFNDKTLRDTAHEELNRRAVVREAEKIE